MPQSYIENILPGIHLNQPVITELKEPWFRKKRIQVFMLRLDEVHPFISGNKIFKLYYFLNEATELKNKWIITFGGAYSNHLAATSFACRELGLKCVGIVRGEEPAIYSPTLLFCREQGMQLKFVTRSVYRDNTSREWDLLFEKSYKSYQLIPEGGFSIKGKKGAALIQQFLTERNFTHFCLPVGTATTLAGMVEGNQGKGQVIGFGVLKNEDDMDSRIAALQLEPRSGYECNFDYTFGGYAKKTEGLLSFMNDFYLHHLIPLDFVYTGKMMFGVFDLARKDYFPPGSEIVCIHTGGLQGNQSLAKGKLLY